ncbi:MAG TPA: hypothetical protein VJT70_06770 [Sphingomicrobium sp.]|nr:hypothetical protein [Sphingomicrobium sp.]
MPRHTLKMLAILTVFAVTPAAAGHFNADNAEWSDCPYERAELIAAGYESLDTTTAGGPVEGSLFDPGRRSSSSLLP